MRSGYMAMPCVECAVDTSVRGVDEYYMVHNAVWATAGMIPRGGMLCVGCLEARIGRRLTSSDFTDVPVNDVQRGWRGSARLLNRLTDRAAVGAAPAA